MGIVGKKISCNFSNESSFIYDDFDYLKFGDLIIAKRYNTEKQRQKIEAGHEIGPYVVLGKSKEGNLLCFYSSSVIPKDFTIRNSLFPLKLSNTSLFNFINKDTYVRTNKVIEINRSRFVKKICSLDLFFIKQLKKRIALNKYNGKIKNGDKLIEYNVPIEAGDIIEEQKNWYLILYFDDNKAVCLPLFRNKTGEVINVGGRNYNVDFNNIVTLYSIKKSKRIGFVDSDIQLSSFLGKIEKNLKYKQEFFIINRGSLIECNGCLYYVYGEEGNNWLAYQVYIDNTKANLANIFINQKSYYSNFKTMVKFDKETTYVVLALANEKEIEYNKKSKKYFLEQKSKSGIKEEKIYKSDIQVGNYVKRFFHGERYIVVWRNNEIVVVVDENDVYTKRYNFQKFDLDDVSSTDKVGYQKMREILDDTKDIIDDILKDKFSDEISDDIPLKKIIG